MLLMLAGSACIGMVVALPVLVHDVIHAGGVLWAGLVRSALIAMLIGLFATISFVVLFRTLAKRPVSGFVSVFLVIFAGTAAALFLNRITSLSLVLFTMGAAEAFGMGFCVLMFNKTRTLNRSLVRKQSELRDLR